MLHAIRNPPNIEPTQLKAGFWPPADPTTLRDGRSLMSCKGVARLRDSTKRGPIMGQTAGKPPS
jgi:hypothetical protein